MTPISHQEMLEAAACGWISRRCRQAYLHDLRGELQTLHSSVDLMVRATKGDSRNADFAEKASSLAKRTMANCESSISRLVDQMVPASESPSVVDVTELANSVVRFVRNDAARKSVTIDLHSTSALFLKAEVNQFRLYLLGLIVATLDGLAPGSVMEIRLSRSKEDAVLEVTSDMPCTSIPEPQMLWQPSHSPLTPYALYLMLAKQWVLASGGELELVDGRPLPNVLRLICPAAEL